MASHSVGKGDDSFGEHQMRIPENDYYTLLILLPDLNSRDAETRTKAWQQFWNSPLADAYRVARSPMAVRRSNNNRIIVK